MSGDIFPMKAERRSLCGRPKSHNRPQISFVTEESFVGRDWLRSHSVRTLSRSRERVGIPSRTRTQRAERSHRPKDTIVECLKPGTKFDDSGSRQNEMRQRWFWPQNPKIPSS